MWLCKKCDYKNNNSSEKCHGDKCGEARGYEWHRHTKPERLDWCQWCDAERTFVMIGKNKWGKGEWSCTVCHKKSIIKGKYKPEDHKKVMTVPDADTGDGAL